MADNYLFERFKEDKRVYNLNQGYWKRKLQSRLEAKLSDENILFKNIDADGKKIYDANPIFTFIDLHKTKGIRIIQDDINLLNQSSEYGDRDLIGAWIDKVIIYDQDDFSEVREIQELVIALFLTKDTVEKTMSLIYRWINEGLTNESIETLLGE